MGVVPTHGPACHKVNSFPAKCPKCGALVHYFECSCGSKVFLVPGKSGATHDCHARTKHRGYTYADLNRENVVRCPRCGISVRGDRLFSHMETKCPELPKIWPRRRMPRGP